MSALNVLKEIYLRYPTNKSTDEKVRKLYEILQKSTRLLKQYSKVDINGEQIFYKTKHPMFKIHLNSEKDQICDLIKETKSDDIFWDIGAHYGVYTCSVGSQLESGVVAAFEPVPSNFDTLVDNTKKNSVKTIACNFGIAKKNSVKTKKIQEDTSWKWNYSETDKTSSVDLQFQNVHNIINELDIPAPDIIKLDVAGSEYSVLKVLTSSQVLEETRLIYVDHYWADSESQQSSIEQKIDILNHFGFMIEDMWDYGNRIGIKFVK